MGQVADIVVASAKFARNYAEQALKGVEANKFGRLANVGGVEINSNHPAWVYGHLSIYPVRIGTMLGKSESSPVNPPRFDDLFANGKPCLDDPKGTIYPPMDAVVKHYFAAYDAALALIGAATDADLAKPNPAEGRFREMFPTIGAVSGFILSAHPMMHLGQVSAWRRCVGLGPAM